MLTPLVVRLAAHPRFIWACHNWDIILERMERKLLSWIINTLSLGGRINLIKGCSETFKFPLLRWQEVCTPYDEGGARIKYLEVMNRALLGKCLWRFGAEPDSLWRHIIAATYGSSPLGWWSNDSSVYRCFAVWKNIASVSNSLRPDARFLLVDGIRVRFWLDPWCGHSTLAESFSFLFLLCPNQNVIVKDCFFHNGQGGVWIPLFRRNFNDEEISELTLLLSCRSSILIPPPITL